MDVPEREQLPPEFEEQPLTARMLDDFATCPRKFLLSFFSTDQDARRLRGGAAALHQAVRQALLDHYQFGGPSQRPVAELLARFEDHWDGRRCADSLEEQQLHAAGLEMLVAYHAAHAAEALTVLATDLRLTGQVAGREFVAVADLVTGPVEREVTVTRLVSSRRPLSAAELGTDISAELLWLLATTRYGEDGAVRVLYYALRQGRAREVSLDAEQAAYLRQDLAARVGRIHREEEFAPRQGSYCRWCRSRSRCPLWRR